MKGKCGKSKHSYVIIINSHENFCTKQKKTGYQQMGRQRKICEYY